MSLEVWLIPFCHTLQVSTFTVENAYKQNGIEPENTKKQAVENETNQSEDPLGDIRSRAQNLVDEAGRAISEAKIKEKPRQYGTQS